MLANIKDILIIVNKGQLSQYNPQTDFRHGDLRKQVEKTDIQGRHLTFIDDFSSSELDNIFRTAELLEPYWRSRAGTTGEYD